MTISYGHAGSAKTNKFPLFCAIEAKKPWSRKLLATVYFPFLSWLLLTSVFLGVLYFFVSDIQFSYSNFMIHKTLLTRSYYRKEVLPYDQSAGDF